ncbi:MAG: aldo/keto reductase [Patescibacteria group bacterium]
MKLALGTVQFGLDYGISNSSGKVEESEVLEILKLAKDSGVDVLDTAYAYGESEQVIGKHLKSHPSDFKVISKVPDCNFDSVEIFVDESLKRLQLKKLYGYLFHNFQIYKKNPFALAELNHLKNVGKIEKIGFSLYYPSELEEIIDGKITCDIIQIPYSLFDQRFESYLRMAKEHGIEIHARSVFLQGLVFKNPRGLDLQFEGIRAKLEKLNALSKNTKMPVSALALNFAILNQYIDKVVIGVDSRDNLRENISDCSLSDQVIKLLPELKKMREDDLNIILPVNWRSKQ